MNEHVIVIVLAALAGLLGAVDLFRTKAQSLLAWGLVALAVSVLVLA